jgi:NDP-sugar pyrophosphorylase family protein
MKALVLSAGYGERLRPLTNTIPKPLLEVGGRPLIHYPLLLLKAAGITEVAINVHHLAASLEKALDDGRSLGLSITYSPEPVLMGTGGPLLALRNYFAGEPFVILNCDTIIDLDLTRMIEFHQAQRGLATLALRDSDDHGAYSRIEIDNASRIRRIRLLKGRPPAEFNDYPPNLSAAAVEALESYMYCGVMICAPDVLSALPQAAPFGLVGDLLAPRLTQGAQLMGFPHNGFFRTVDDLAGYQALRDEFAHGAPPLTHCRLISD